MKPMLFALSEFRKYTMDKGQKESGQPENTSEEISGPGPKGAKKQSVLARFKKLFSSPGADIDAKTIQHLIDQNKFKDAIKKLITVMKSSEVPVPIRPEDIDLLYRRLEKKMFQVVTDSVVKVNEDLLIQVLKAIKKQEKEDSTILQNGDINRRPRRLKEKCIECIEASVSQQSSRVLRITTSKSSASLSQKLHHLGKTFKEHLIQLIKNLSPHYPAEFNVRSLCVQCYHKHLASMIGSITENELDKEDTYFLLSWIHNIYPKILRDPAIQEHIDESKMESLLPPRKIQKLERNFLGYEMKELETTLEKSLQMEAKRWNDGIEPPKLGKYYKSTLQTEVTKKFKESVQRGAEISEEMSLKMAPLLGQELHKFLTRYLSLVVEYTQKKKSQWFRAITIANLNCSLEFRNLLERKDLTLESEVKKNLSVKLCEFETIGYDAILQDMFKELKSRFTKLCHRKDCKPTFPNILDYVKSCVTSLKPLCQPCFQVAIEKLHFQVVLEYITRLMQDPVRFEDDIQLRAWQIIKNANSINGLFQRQGSQKTSLYPLLGKLAEIIKLENLEDIVQKISELVEKYPDIEGEHIIAIFHIKGNMDRPQVGSALVKIGRRITRFGNRAKYLPLFSLIKPYSSKWLLDTDTGCRRCCLSHGIIEMCTAIEFRFNSFIDYFCKKFKVDTPPRFYPHNPDSKISKAQASRIKWILLQENPFVEFGGTPLSTPYPTVQYDH